MHRTLIIVLVATLALALGVARGQAVGGTVTNASGGMSIGFASDQLAGTVGLAVNGHVYLNGPGQNAGLAQIHFGPNVDLQSNTAGSGPTFGTTTGEVIHSLLRRDYAVGVTGSAWIQGEGVNSANSSFRPSAIEFVQTSSLAGSESGEFRIYTKASTDPNPTLRLTVDAAGVHMGGGTLAVVGGALQWTSPAGRTTVLGPN